MATSNSVFYSWGAAKRPRSQKQTPCDIGGLSASRAIVNNEAVGVNGITVSLRREVTMPDPRAGYDETFSIVFSIEEIERIAAFAAEMKAKYGAAPDTSIVKLQSLRLPR